MRQLIDRNRKILLIGFLSCLVLTSSFAQSERTDSADGISVSTPEAEGVSSAGILKFLDAVAAGNNEIHSFVIVRHGKIISEGWWHPYGRERKHVMFSVSKSFTSIGVGLAIAEGKLKLTDKVVSFFPQSLPDTMTLYTKEMTVVDLLKMSAGMNTDPLFQARSGPEWPKAFLSSKIENKPGTVFKYNNMASFMLSAIVQKATGEKLLDFLKPRLFDPLGIKDVTWDETPEGYTFGAIGLRLRSEEMARFGQMMLQKGKWNGRQVVPQSWVEEATSFKIQSNDPGNKQPKELNDWEQGYGYQFWMCRHNAYRADGLGGQFVIVMPEKEAVVVLTSGATNTQEVLNLVWDFLLPAMHDKSLPKDKGISTELAKRIASLTVSKPTSSSNGNPALLSRISGKTIEFDQNEIGIDGLGISFNSNDARVEIDHGGNNKYELTAGLDKWIYSQTKINTLAAPPRPNQALPIDVASKYSWLDGSTIELTSKFVEQSIWSEVWKLSFQENGSAMNVRLEITGMRPRIIEGRVK